MEASSSSSSQLNEPKKRKKLPAIGYKINRSVNPEQEKEEISSMLLEQKELLQEERTEISKLLIKAEWDPTLNEAKVTKNAGSSLTTFGHSRNRCLYLYPEETLYLMEVNKLQLFYNDVRMSIQRSFSLLLNSSTNITVERYRAFKHFLVHGYKLFRHMASSFSEPKESLVPAPVEEKKTINSHEEYCKALQIFSPVIEDGKDVGEIPEILYDIYLPQSSFQKSSRPKPDYLLSIITPQDDMFNLFRLLSLTNYPNLLFAAVSENSISIFNLQGVQIPDMF